MRARSELLANSVARARLRRREFAILQPLWVQHLHRLYVSTLEHGEVFKPTSHHSSSYLPLAS
jgi:hypothetical protein